MHNKDTKETKHSNLTANDLREALSDSGDNIKQFSSQLVEELTEFLESKKSELNGMKGKCKNQIKENPFIAVFGALAIGALIGMICKK